MWENAPTQQQIMIMRQEIKLTDISSNYSFCKTKTRAKKMLDDNYPDFSITEEISSII